MSEHPVKQACEGRLEDNMLRAMFHVGVAGMLLLGTFVCDFGVASAQIANRPVLLGNEVLIAASDKNGAHYDVRISSDPKDARHLVVCDIRVLLPHLSDSVYISFDGGQKWKHTLQNTVGSDLASDAFCTIDNSHQVLFTGTAFAKPRFVGDIYARGSRGSPANFGSQSADVFYRSENGGLTSKSRTWSSHLWIARKSLAYHQATTRKIFMSLDKGSPENRPITIFELWYRAIEGELLMVLWIC